METRDDYHAWLAALVNILSSIGLAALTITFLFWSTRQFYNGRGGNMNASSMSCSQWPNAGQHEKAFARSLTCASP